MKLQESVFRQLKWRWKVSWCDANGRNLGRKESWQDAEQAWESQYGDILSELVGFPDFKTDDKVLVKDLPDGCWNPRHFAGWATDGKILCWKDGTTSWSWPWRGKDGTKIWQEWKLPEGDVE